MRTIYNDKGVCRRVYNRADLARAFGLTLPTIWYRVNKGQLPGYDTEVGKRGAYSEERFQAILRDYGLRDNSPSPDDLTTTKEQK